MRAKFQGHGVGQLKAGTSWFAPDCIHPNTTGHEEIRKLFFSGDRSLTYAHTHAREPRRSGSSAEHRAVGVDALVADLLRADADDDGDVLLALRAERARVSAAGDACGRIGDCLLAFTHASVADDDLRARHATLEQRLHLRRRAPAGGTPLDPSPRAVRDAHDPSIFSDGPAVVQCSSAYDRVAARPALDCPSFARAKRVKRAAIGATYLAQLVEP